MKLMLSVVAAVLLFARHAGAGSVGGREERLQAYRAAYATWKAARVSAAASARTAPEYQRLAARFEEARDKQVAAIRRLFPEQQLEIKDAEVLFDRDWREYAERGPLPEGSKDARDSYIATKQALESYLEARNPALRTAARELRRIKKDMFGASEPYAVPSAPPFPTPSPKLHVPPPPRAASVGNVDSGSTRGRAERVPPSKEERTERVPMSKEERIERAIEIRNWILKLQRQQRQQAGTSGGGASSPDQNAEKPPVASEVRMTPVMPPPPPPPPGVPLSKEERLKRADEIRDRIGKMRGRQESGSPENLAPSPTRETGKQVQPPSRPAGLPMTRGERIQRAEEIRNQIRAMQAGHQPGRDSTSPRNQHSAPQRLLRSLERFAEPGGSPEEKRRKQLTLKALQDADPESLGTPKLVHAVCFLAAKDKGVIEVRWISAAPGADGVELFFNDGPSEFAHFPEWCEEANRQAAKSVVVFTGIVHTRHTGRWGGVNLTALSSVRLTADDRPVSDSLHVVRIRSNDSSVENYLDPKDVPSFDDSGKLLRP